MLDKDVVAPMVARVIVQHEGMNIGTTLQNSLEERINRILYTTGWKYEFNFNMSGGTEHVFYDEQGNRQELFN